MFSVRFAKKSGVQPCEPKPRLAEARKTRSAGFGTRTTVAPLSKPGIGCALHNTRIAKPPKTGAKQPQTNNNFLYPPRHYAASGLLNLPNHADKSRDPCHSGCEVAGGEDKTKSAANWQHAPSKTYTRKNAAIAERRSKNGQNHRNYRIHRTQLSISRL